jgi:hypothetical protein
MSLLKIPCTLEQEHLIAEHLLSGKNLFVHPNERRYLIRQVARLAPGSTITSAEIDLENAQWLVTCAEGPK